MVRQLLTLVIRSLLVSSHSIVDSIHIRHVQGHMHCDSVNSLLATLWYCRLDIRIIAADSDESSTMGCSQSAYSHFSSSNHLKQKNASDTHSTA